MGEERRVEQGGDGGGGGGDEEGVADRVAWRGVGAGGVGMAAAVEGEGQVCGGEGGAEDDAGFLGGEHQAEGEAQQDAPAAAGGEVAEPQGAEGEGGEADEQHLLDVVAAEVDHRGRHGGEHGGGGGGGGAEAAGEWEEEEDQAGAEQGGDEAEVGVAGLGEGAGAAELEDRQGEVVEARPVELERVVAVVAAVVEFAGLDRLDGLVAVERAGVEAAGARGEGGGGGEQEQAGGGDCGPAAGPPGWRGGGRGAGWCGGCRGIRILIHGG